MTIIPRIGEGQVKRGGCTGRAISYAIQDESVWIAASNSTNSRHVSDFLGKIGLKLSGFLSTYEL